MLAIDLGTSGCKAAVVDPAGRVLARARSGVETLRVPGQGAEQDPEQVWRAVLEAGARVVGESGRGKEVVAVAIGSQYSSLIPVDDAGRPTHNMILWQDQRGAPAALGLRDGWLRKLRWLRIHGIPPLDSGIDSLAHARFLARAKPEVWARTATVLEPADYLALRMSGRAATNPCTAFLMLLVDNRPGRHARPRYHPALLDYAGIDAAKLPELLPVDASLGELRPEVAEALGLPAGVELTAPVNDTVAAAMGSGSFRGSHAGLSIGTTSVMVTHVDRQKTDIRNGIVSMPGALPGSFLVMAENGIGGRALEHFLERLVFAVDDFGDHDLDDKFRALEQAVAGVEAGSGGVLFLPWLAGSHAPAEDGRVRGGFLNLSLETDRTHMGRAVLEGVALNFRWLREPVERFTGRSLSQLYFYGGGARSELWAQILADVLELPVRVAADPGFVACRGLAYLALYRRGVLDLDELDAQVPDRARFDPRPEHGERYRQLFEQYVRAFRANRPIFHALNPPSQS